MLKNAVANYAVVYLVIGIAIVGSQRLAGTRCDPPRTVPKVTANYPFAIVGALIWPTSFYEQVWKRDIP